MKMNRRVFIIGAGAALILRPDALPAVKQVTEAHTAPMLKIWCDNPGLHHLGYMMKISDGDWNYMEWDIEMKEPGWLEIYSYHPHQGPVYIDDISVNGNWPINDDIAVNYEY